jgi:hypothetical protein
MTQVADKLALIDRATERANTPRASKKPVFLFLSEGQKALIRPVVNLSQAPVMAVHNKWSDKPEYRVNVICAAEIGKPCDHCDSAKVLEDKKLQASDVFFVPVYVYSVIEVKTGKKVTYKERDEHDREVEKPIGGFRVLELPLFGKAFSILQALRAYVRDEESHDIRACDFSIEQMGSGKTKNFIITPKAPKTVDPRITQACPAVERFVEAILSARPPLVATSSSDEESSNPLAAPVTPADSSETDDDGIFDF